MKPTNWVSPGKGRKSMASSKVITSLSLKVGLAPGLPPSKRCPCCLYQSSISTYMIVSRSSKGILFIGKVLHLVNAITPHGGGLFPYVNSINSHHPLVSLLAQLFPLPAQLILEILKLFRCGGGLLG